MGVVLPPVQLDDPRESGADEQVTVAQWSDGEWIVDFCDPAERGQIAVVVMIVAEEYEMNVGQFVQGEARRMHPFGADFTKGSATDRVNRIDENIALGRLDQKRGMVDQGRANSGGGKTWTRCGRGRDINRPGLRAAGEFPA